MYNFTNEIVFDAYRTSVVRPRLLEAQLCLTLPSMSCASMRIWRVRAIYLMRGTHENCMIFHQLVSLLASHQRLETYKARHPEDPSWMFYPALYMLDMITSLTTDLPKVTSPHEPIMGVAAGTQSGWCFF